jgi:ABC-type dipeptide/oligopeptide/nickel transport system ATPase component
VLQKGKLVEYASARRIMTHPRHAYTQNLIASIPRI